jgi:hypothetical protein
MTAVLEIWLLVCEIMAAYAGRRYITNALDECWSFTTLPGQLAELTVGDDKFEIAGLDSA